MQKKNTKRRILYIFSVIVAIILALVITYFVQSSQNRISKEFTLDEAQVYLTNIVESLPNPSSPVAKFVGDNTTVKVNDMSYGNEKNLILECTYETYDIKSVIEANVGQYILGAYEMYLENEAAGTMTNATKIKLNVADAIKADLEQTDKINGEIVLEIFEVNPGEFQLYLNDETVNAIFGGLVGAKAIINAADTVEYNQETVSIATKNTLRTGIKDCISLYNYSSAKPDTAIPLVKAFNTFKFDFYRNFIEMDRYMYLVNGLINTLKITVLAVLIGVLIGFLVAIIRVTNQKTGKLSFISGICKVYLSIMRGTPVMVQLLIIYFVILLPIGVEKFTAAVICFGLNSGAYVSEIVRGGIMSIDIGQTEAGRSLGFNYMQTMMYIVIPQAFKAVLPSLANEFIALLKESSVAFYIGVADLTLGGLKIRSITYSNYMPLIAVAVVYLILVLGLSQLVSIMERRLNKGDKR